MDFLGFLGNVAQGMLNYGATQSTNDSNYRINQMNNEFNERMMDKQFGYNVQLMDKQNNYNSAVEQVKRLREAGLNPALALGHVASGSATSAQPNPTSAAHANGNATMVAPQFNGLSDALRYMIDRQLADEEIANKREDTKEKHINNQYLSLMRMQELQNLINSNRDKSLDIEMKIMQKSIYSDMLNEQFKSLQLQNRDTEQAIQMKVFQNMMLDKQLNVFDTDFKMKMSLMSAQISEALASGELKRNQATHEVLKWLETTARTDGLKISNDVAERSADFIVKQAELNAIPAGPFEIGRSAQSLYREFKHDVKYHGTNLIKFLDRGASKEYMPKH